jgi:putative membrane protein
LAKLLIRWFINAVALAAAAYLVPGISVGEGQAWATVAIMSIIFGLVNALIRPLLKVLTCPLILLTLGLFTLIINGLMLWLSSWIAGQLDVGFQVAGFWPAFWGALVISIVSFVLSLIFGEDDDRRRRQRREEHRRDRW